MTTHPCLRTLYEQNRKLFVFVIGFTSIGFLFYSWATYDLIDVVLTLHADLAADAVGVKLPDMNLFGPFFLFIFICVILLMVFVDSDQRPLPRRRLGIALAVAIFSVFAISFPASILLRSHYRTLVESRGYLACTRPIERGEPVYAKTLEDCEDVLALKRWPYEGAR